MSEKLQPIPEDDSWPLLQRLLGRCMLQLQQYEKLIKAMIARQAFAVSSNSVPQQILENRSKQVAGLTLGNLIRSFSESTLVDQEAADLETEDVSSETTAMAFSYRFRIGMPPTEHERTIVALRELVSLRNALVHHFPDNCDLTTSKGRMTAIDYLRICNAKFDGHLLQLQSWASIFDHTAKAARLFLESEQFKQLFYNGIMPDGRIEWPMSGIVNALREASTKFAKNGWANLQEAADWIGVQYPDQTPVAYRCKRWRQVIHESKLFDLAYRVDQSGNRLAWFRERGLHPTH